MLPYFSNLFTVLLKTHNSLNRYELYPCVYDIFDSESALELNPKIVTLTPGTPCIYVYICVCVCVCVYIYIYI